VKALDALLPRSLGVALLMVVGLLAVPPLLAWSYIDGSIRETREAFVVALRSQAAGPRLLTDKAPSEGVRAVARNGAVGGVGDAIASNGCKPAGGAACPASSAAVALPPDPLALNPVGASLAIALPDPAPGNFLATAGAIYLGIVAMALVFVAGLLRRLSDFRAAVEVAILSRSTMPALIRQSAPREFAGVIRSLEQLVADLGYATGQLRTAAEDNAHALRTPLATVNAALFTLRRYLPAEPRAERAVKVIELSVDRMSVLVDAAQEHGQSVAALVEAPRQRVDLAVMVQSAIAGVAEDARERGIFLRQKLDHPVIVLASIAALERALRGVLLSAIEHSSLNGDVGIELSSADGSALLSVEDAGFDEPQPGEFGKTTSTSTRDCAVAVVGPPAGLAGVQRAIESLGGKMETGRLANGGMKIVLSLPRDEIWSAETGGRT
jgi:signal transduction histidine kinase